MSVTLKRRAYDAIRNKLLLGDLPANGRLSEVALAKEFGASRGPIREAISQLESEGLVMVVPKLGAFVRRLDRAELQHLYQFREWLVSAIVPAIVQRIDDDHLRELRVYCGDMMQIAREHRESGNEHITKLQYLQLVSADLSFHLTLFRAAGNPMVMRVVSGHHIIGKSFNQCPQTLSNIIRSYREHRRILRAVSARSVDLARELLVEHTRSAGRRVIESYDKQRLQVASSESQGDVSSWQVALQQMIEQVEKEQSS